MAKDESPAIRSMLPGSANKMYGKDLITILLFWIVIGHRAIVFSR
jgi:hypothetical protein